MPQHKITVTLPQPCNENWDTMSPTDKGRHCAMCQKTVIDFSLMNDGEIIEMITKAKHKQLCGHFLNSQLDRELVDTRYKPSFASIIAKRIAATVILLQSVAVTALAQHVKGKAAAAYHNSSKKKSAANSIKGRVIDVASGQPMPGMRVKISWTGQEALTDYAGRFSLELSADTSKPVVLVCYPNQETAIARDSFFIMDHQVTLAEIAAGKEIVLFRTPIETLPEHNITSYAQPLVMRYSSHSGGALTVTEIKHFPTTTSYTLSDRAYNLWHKVTKPFRRKTHHNDE